MDGIDDNAMKIRTLAALAIVAHTPFTFDIAKDRSTTTPHYSITTRA